jgi:CRISPR-associated Csx11 family protein
VTSFNHPKYLRNYRPLLLACEAIGWLHMAGKAKEEFLKTHGGHSKNYDYKKCFENECLSFPQNDPVNWLNNEFNLKKDLGLECEPWPTTAFDEFLTKHTAQEGKGFLGLLQAGHGMASGIEKNLPKNASWYLGQDLTHMWLTTAFGHPVRNLLYDPSEVLGPEGWQRLVEEIRCILEKLRELGQLAHCHEEVVNKWLKWREESTGPGSFLRRAFSSTLAETRLPNNDVTLWDQSYVAAALFKSAAVAALLEAHPQGNHNQKTYLSDEVKSKTQWRLLTIGISYDHYESRSVKIGDLNGARQAIDNFFAKARRLIEIDLAVGSLIYRDASVLIFTFPGERTDDNLLASWLKVDDWKDYLQGELDKYAQWLWLETPPYCKLSEPTRSLVPLVKERRNALNKLAVPVHRHWEIKNKKQDGAKGAGPEKNNPSGHTCPVCLVRLNGDSKNKNMPCEVCKERRQGRFQRWLSGTQDNDTIWLEEAADENGRIALLTFQLDLEPWLEGKRMDSLRAQSVPGWRSNNPKIKDADNPVRLDNPFDSLLKEIKKQFRNKKGKYKFENGKSIFTILPGGFSNFKTNNKDIKDKEDKKDKAEELWKRFFALIVEDRAISSELSWDKLERDERRARWLAHQLFCKLPSPGRVYRFWRQGEDFFRELLSVFRLIVCRHPNRWRVRRLWLEPDDTCAAGWKEGLYNGRITAPEKLKGQPLSVVYTSRDGLAGFVTAGDLSGLLAPEEPLETLNNLRLELWDPDSTLFDQKSGGKELRIKKIKGQRKIKSQRKDKNDFPLELGHLGVYSPVIPLELSPLRFRVLVPLKSAPECLDFALKKWEEEFARVKDRLPLRAGVVAFLMKTSFQAVISTVRQIEEEFNPEDQGEMWEVLQNIKAKETTTIQFLRRVKEGSKENKGTEEWVIPITLPDGRPDDFYPYMAVKNGSLLCPRDFQHPDGQLYRHAADLSPGDRIIVHPGSVSLTFMDNPAPQRERPLKCYPQQWRQMRQTWLTIIRASPSFNQLRWLQQELNRLYASWKVHKDDEARKVWLDLARSLLQSTLKVRGETLNELVEAAHTGVLLRAIDWHLSILKEKPVTTEG